MRKVLHIAAGHKGQVQAFLHFEGAGSTRKTVPDGSMTV